MGYDSFKCKNCGQTFNVEYECDDFGGIHYMDGNYYYSGSFDYCSSKCIKEVSDKQMEKWEKEEKIKKEREKQIRIGRENSLFSMKRICPTCQRTAYGAMYFCKYCGRTFCYSCSTIGSPMKRKCPQCEIEIAFCGIV